MIVFLAACGQSSSNAENNSLVMADTTRSTTEVTAPLPFLLPDTTIKFLWRENRYHEEYKDSVSYIVINEDYCKIIPDQCKAAIGYVATFVGNECWWDGNANNDRSNLKCKILTALNLGYQCSDTHLGYLKHWFKGDEKSIKELEFENCPTTPYTSTIQDTFDEITLIVKGDEIQVHFKATAMNTREQSTSSWIETDYFQYSKEHIRLINKEEKL